VGAKWLSTIGAGGSIARVTPARGGIITLNAATGTTTHLSQDNILQVTMQDAWRLYSRWQVAETVTTSGIVGIGDTSLVNPTDGVAWVVDTAVGVNYYLRGTRAGAVTNKDSTIAVDTSFHVFELVSTAAGVVTGYIDGTARGGGLTAAQCPVVTIDMQPVINSTPLAAPDANLSIDVYKLVLSRNTGVGPI
ncbi:TrbG/VirB9 family P-type conjugative transfer protein, partial [Candidatus Magnetobacterium casense]